MRGKESAVIFQIPMPVKIFRYLLTKAKIGQYNKIGQSAEKADSANRCILGGGKSVISKKHRL